MALCHFAIMIADLQSEHFGLLVLLTLFGLFDSGINLKVTRFTMRKCRYGIIILVFFLGGLKLWYLGIYNNQNETDIQKDILKIVCNEFNFYLDPTLQKKTHSFVCVSILLTKSHNLFY